MKIFGFLLTWGDQGLTLTNPEGIRTTVTHGELTMYAVIAGICIGMIVAMIVSYFTRRKMNRIVKAFLDSDRTTPEKAGTVSEIGIDRTPGIKRLLRAGGTLRRTVECANPDEAEHEAPAPAGAEKAVRKIFSRDRGTVTDFETARFYIPEEKMESAEDRFAKEKMPPFMLVVWAILLIAAAVGAAFVIPELLKMAGNIFG